LIVGELEDSRGRLRHIVPRGDNSEAVGRNDPGDLAIGWADEKHGPIHGGNSVKLARENQSFATRPEGHQVKITYAERLGKLRSWLRGEKADVGQTAARGLGFQFGPLSAVAD